ILRGIKDDNTDEGIARELSNSDEVIRPFVLACHASNNQRLLTTAVHCLQQLVSRHAINPSSVRETLQTLGHIAGGGQSGGVDVQVKVLQMVLPLVTFYSECVSGEALVAAFDLCLTLQRSRDAVVGNTAAAILRQMVVAVFDRVNPESPDQCPRDAYYVLQDLCLLAADQSPVFIGRSAPAVDKRVVLELIESVLANHAQVIADHAGMAQALRERLVPFLVAAFGGGGDRRLAFGVAVRCSRIAALFVRRLFEDLAPECELLIAVLSRAVASDSSDSSQLLALEAARALLRDAPLLHAQYDGRDEGGCHVVRDLVSAVCGVVSSAQRGVIGQHVIGAESCGVRLALAQQLDKAEAPAVPPAYGFYLASMAVVDLAGGLESRLLMSHAWEAVNAALAVLILEAKTDDALFALTLAAAQRLAEAAGALGEEMDGTRDAMLALLCRASVSADDGRRVQSLLRAVVGTAQRLALTLRAAWGPVLAVFESAPAEDCAIIDGLLAAAGHSADAAMWVIRGLRVLGSDQSGITEAGDEDEDREDEEVRRLIAGALGGDRPPRVRSSSSSGPVFAVEQLRRFAVAHVDLLSDHGL
ncbi:Endocytosis and vacuole integrity protein, partial [Coemansia aciculifera]